MSSIRERTARALLWSAVEITARYGTQFLVTLALARLLTPSDFGLIAMLAVFTSFGAVLTDAGFGTALIQRKVTTRDDESTVFYYNIAASLLMAGLLWIGAEAIAHFFTIPELASLTRLTTVAIPLGALGAVPDALLTKRLDFRSRTHAQLVASIPSGCLAVFLAWRGFGPWSLIWQGIAATALRSTFLWIYSQWRPLGTFRLASFRTLFGFGGYMLVSSLLFTVAGRLQSVIIGKWFDARSLGYFSLAQSVPDAPMSFMGTLLNRVGFPVFSAISDRPEQLREALRKSLRLSMFLFIPCMFGIALVSRPLIVTVYGEQWAPSVPIVALLSIAASLFPLHVLNLSVLKAQGRSDRFFRLEVFKHLTIVVLTLAAAPYGPIGIAAAMIVVNVICAAINTWYSGKGLKFGLIAQILDQRETVALTAVAFIPAWFVLHSNKLAVVPTLLAVAISILVYFSCAAMLRHPAFADLLGIFRNLPGRSVEKTS